MSTAPVNIGMMEAVPVELRGVAMGVAALSSHLLGDLIPPVLVGTLLDATGSLVPGMWMVSLWTIWCVLFWYFAYLKATAPCSDSLAAADGGGLDSSRDRLASS
eukprot:gnl/TRDRNA2_/TRDRNA2_143055_c1_seq1.p1 gnl/TRDRNA2_/TRDRNA2_143055_c1~~gnl/TRDRNA2_/TRDRNA2_143055_c1_seq1.p1  ORF type:complete len:115 (-),score=19.49 gnl/TRDRNA2_/TRDRNA2_143055_c1_seq1:17-328(-)